ncbi:hypothetical protein [Vibrio chagasii]|uniref:hypothetical protein n=1 Tax=Vibrio chagasii TaxID=170679 RepID=UPI003DA1A5BA
MKKFKVESESVGDIFVIGDSKLFPLAPNMRDYNDFSYLKDFAVSLSTPELRFLQILIEESNKNQTLSDDPPVVGRLALIEYIWGVESDYIDKGTNLNQLKCTLSKKIKNIINEEFIITHPRVGYSINKEFLAVPINEENYSSLLRTPIKKVSKSTGFEKFEGTEESEFNFSKLIYILLSVILLFLIIDTFIIMKSHF